MLAGESLHIDAVVNSSCMMRVEFESTTRVVPVPECVVIVATEDGVRAKDQEIHAGASGG